MKQTMKSQLFPGPVSMAAHVRCWQSGRFTRSGWCPCQALASVSGNTESPHRRADAGRPQDTRSHAAAAEFSGLVFTAAIADGRAHTPRGIVLTEAKGKRDRFRAAPQNGRRRKAFSPFKGLRSAERKRKRTPLPTGEVRPSEHDNDF